jgi:biotin transporter BioY
MFAALTAIGAFIRVPIPASPVPITLQVFFVLLAGLLLGSKWAGMSMIVYVMLGIIGFPVFSGVAGLSVPQSVVIGVLPFLPGDAIKLAAALIVSRLVGPVIR